MHFLKRESYNAAVRRVMMVNPTAGITLGEILERNDEQAFLECLLEIAGAGEVVIHCKSDLTKAFSFMREGRVVDSVEWRASRHTKVYQFERAGQNYRLWWWKHADNHDIGEEAIVYKESPELSQFEMAFYD
jgi:hypothetical protein